MKSAAVKTEPRKRAIRTAKKPSKKPDLTPSPLDTARHQYTYADYEKFPDDFRCEIIDGKIYMMAAPTGEHQRIVGEMYRLIANFLVGKPCVVYPAPYDVRLFAAEDQEEDDKKDKTVVQPDIVVICGKEKRKKDGCHGAPDLAIEILSESTRVKDMIKKTAKYLEAGVREYWMVDPDTKMVMIYKLAATPDGPRFNVENHEGTEKIPVGIFKGKLSIDMKSVFAAGDEG
jgi:Uma2 family endonuclease